MIFLSILDPDFFWSESGEVVGWCFRPCRSEQILHLSQPEIFIKSSKSYFSCRFFSSRKCGVNVYLCSIIDLPDAPPSTSSANLCWQVCPLIFWHQCGHIVGDLSQNICSNTEIWKLHIISQPTFRQPGPGLDRQAEEKFRDTLQCIGFFISQMFLFLKCW